MAFAGEVAVWWALLTGLWLITLSSLSVPEGIAAVACAFVAAIATAGARRAMEGAWRPKRQWLRWVAPVIVSIPVDTFRVLRLAARRCISRDRTVGDEVERLPVRDREPTAVGAARRALGTFAVSVTPATVVIDWDPDSGEMVLHRLVPSAPLERKVLR